MTLSPIDCQRTLCRMGGLPLPPQIVKSHSAPAFLRPKEMI